jgi:hypothetical protein
LCVIYSYLPIHHSSHLWHWFSFHCARLRVQFSWNANCRSVTNKIKSLVLIWNVTIFWLPLGRNEVFCPLFISMRSN